MLDEQADKWSERYMLDSEYGKMHGIKETAQVNIRDGEARSQGTPSIKQHV